MEKEHITASMNAEDFAYLRLLARRMGFTEEFVKPGPSRVRGIPADPSKVYASFVRNGNAKGKKGQ